MLVQRDKPRVLQLGHACEDQVSSTKLIKPCSPEKISTAPYEILVARVDLGMINKDPELVSDLVTLSVQTGDARLGFEGR